jgi:hypothetical protein
MKIWKVLKQIAMAHPLSMSAKIHEKEFKKRKLKTL